MSVLVLNPVILSTLIHQVLAQKRVSYLLITRIAILPNHSRHIPHTQSYVNFSKLSYQSSYIRPYQLIYVGFVLSGFGSGDALYHSWPAVEELLVHFSSPILLILLIRAIIHLFTN